MKLNIKRKITIVTIFMILLSMIGCINASVGTDTKINLDGSSNTKIKISYDDTIAKFSGDGLLNKIVKSDNLVVEKYNQDNMNIEEIELKTEKIPLKELLDSNNNLVTKVPQLEEYINVSCIRKKQIFKDVYTVNISLKKDVFKEMSESIELGDSGISKYLDGNISSFLGEIPYDMKLSIPFKITDSNASNKIDEKTVEWNYKLSDLNSNTNLNISFIAPNVRNITIGIIISIVAIILIIIMVVIRKKHNRNQN